MKRTRTGPRRDEAREQRGVGRRQRRGRDLRDARVVVRAPGVGQPVVVGADRADEEAGRAELRGGRRAGAADVARRAVARAVRGARGRLVDEDDPSPDGVGGLAGELLERGHPDDLALEPSVGRGHASAEGRQRERLADGRRDLPGLGAALPGGDHDLLRANVLEPLGPEHPDRELDGRAVPGGSGEPGPREVGDVADPVGRPRAGEDPVPKLDGGRPDGGRDGGVGGRGGPGDRTHDEN